MYGIVYKATNLINGKFYIGQTVLTLNRRIANHVSHSMNCSDNIYFHKAIRKYGAENFVWEVLAKCNTCDELNDMEKRFIREHGAFKVGYNRTIGGVGRPGYRHSAESRKRMSIMNKGANNPNYGKHHSENAKRKISAANKGRLVGAKHPLSKKYVITTPSGEKKIVHGLNKFCKKHTKDKISAANLTKVARGVISQHKGYKCKYYEGEL